jgi:hypothetical protein
MSRFRQRLRERDKLISSRNKMVFIKFKRKSFFQNLMEMLKSFFKKNKHKHKKPL